MNEYRDYILDLAKQRKNVVFYNTGPSHATFVLKAIFENAQYNINLYAGSLSGQIYDLEEYKSSIEKFLKRGGQLKILLDQETTNFNEESNLLKSLKFYAIANPTQIMIKTHPFHIKKNENSSNLHFMIGDSSMYRIETDAYNYTSTTNFNDPQTANSLISIFDAIFKDTQSNYISLDT